MPKIVADPIRIGVGGEKFPRTSRCQEIVRQTPDLGQVNTADVAADQAPTRGRQILNIYALIVAASIASGLRPAPVRAAEMPPSKTLRISDRSLAGAFLPLAQRHMHLGRSC
jgi:hypothetical protein